MFERKEELGWVDEELAGLGWLERKEIFEVNAELWLLYPLMRRPVKLV